MLCFLKICIIKTQSIFGDMGEGGFTLRLVSWLLQHAKLKAKYYNFIILC